MTDTDTDIEMTREVIADDEMHASPRLNSLKEITALWHLCSRVLRLYISNEGWQEVGYIDKKSSSHKKRLLWLLRFRWRGAHHQLAATKQQVAHQVLQRVKSLFNAIF